MRSIHTTPSSFCRDNAEFKVMEVELHSIISSHDLNSTQSTVPQEYFNAFHSKSSPICHGREIGGRMVFRDSSVHHPSNEDIQIDSPVSDSPLWPHQESCFQSHKTVPINKCIDIGEKHGHMLTPCRPGDPVAKFLNSQC